MTLFELLNQGIKELEEAGCSDSQIDARELLLSSFSLSMSTFLLERMKEQEDTKQWMEGVDNYKALIEIRKTRKPLQHILKSQEFMGLSFFVNEHVLIPRQDTETLVELILEQEVDKCNSVLDLCTGSGCIGISLKVYGQYKSVTATDLSEQALIVAKKNQENLCEEKIIYYQGDLFQALENVPKEEKLFDVIVSNPPYIATSVIYNLEPEVKIHEPWMALDGLEDGLFFYREIIRAGKEYLKAKGRMYFEIGWDQGKAVKELFEANGYENIHVKKDLLGNDRVVFAIKK